MTDSLIRRYSIIGSRRASNYIWALVSAFGGLDFLLTGISSYFNFNLIPGLIHSERIVFFPQGIIMCFYGILGLLFSFYLSLTILWNVGGGFNIFDQQNKIIRIFRWGFPGKNRRIDLVYSLDDITAIRLEIKQGLNPRRTIYACVKDQRQIPLTPTTQPIAIEEVEKLASDLAQFLHKNLLTSP